VILTDAEGEIEVRIGDEFVCNLNGGKALMQVLHPYFSREKRGEICCKVIRGAIVDLEGKSHGPGTFGDLPASRVAAAVRRYRNRDKISPNEEVSTNS
jgi:hypothetical protein